MTTPKLDERGRVAGMLLAATMLGGCYTGLVEDDAERARIEVLDGMFVDQPDPGTSVVMEILYEDGASDLITVSTDDSDEGRVEIDYHEDFGLVLPDGAAASCQARCSHNEYSLLGYKWNEKLRWRYRDNNRPSNMTRTQVEKALKHGFSSITTSRNTCNMADQVSATHQYLGTTNKAPNVTSTGCGSPDGTNVVGWGGIAGSAVGLTCTWFVGGTAVESDMRFDKNESWFPGNKKPQGCSGALSLRAVATHEAGHAFGLNHSSCGQTMAPSVPACVPGRRNLGRGDILGLRALY